MDSGILLEELSPKVGIDTILPWRVMRFERSLVVIEFRSNSILVTKRPLRQYSEDGVARKKGSQTYTSRLTILYYY